MATNCAWCATDEFVEFDSERGVAVCSGPGHPDARMWEPEPGVVYVWEKVAA